MLGHSKNRPFLLVKEKPFSIFIKALAVLVFLALPSLALARDPDCAGVDRWPTASSFAALKSAGLLNGDDVDLRRTKTVRLASEKISRNRYRQIHDIIFFEKNGRKIEVIANSIVSAEECSESSVQIFLISGRLPE